MRAEAHTGLLGGICQSQRLVTHTTGECTASQRANSASGRELWKLTAVCFCYPNDLGEPRGILGIGLETLDAIGGA